VLCREFLLNRRQQTANDRVGNVGKSQVRPVDVTGVTQNLNTHLELRVIRPAAGDVEHILHIARPRQTPGEIFRHRFGIGQFIEKAKFKHAIEQKRVSAQPFRKSRCAADNFGHQGQQGRVGLKQREELYASGKSRQEIIKPAERRIGIRCSRQRLKNGRQNFCQNLSCAGAADSPVATMMPSSYGRRDSLRVAEAHLAERFDRVGMVFATGKGQSAGATQ
jgi:hypothetical protein